MMITDEPLLALPDDVSTSDGPQGSYPALAGSAAARPADILSCIAQAGSNDRIAERGPTTLRTQAADVIIDVFTMLSLPAFICDASGEVQALTPAADHLIGNASSLRLKGNQLLAANEADSESLLDAIAVAAESSARCRTLVLRSGAPGEAALVLNVLQLSVRGIDVPSKRQVLVMPQIANVSEARCRLVLQQMGLTAAEIGVAMLLSQGCTAESIATQRRVSIATVRAQIKCILAKFGCTRQIELVARLARL